MNCVYLHVPKCAGTSFTEVLNHLYGANEHIICPAKVDCELELELASPKAAQYKLYTGHFSQRIASDIPNYDNSLKLSIFRDPIDRCISLYWYLRGHSSLELETVNDYQKMHILYAKSFSLEDILSLPDDSLWKQEYSRCFSQFIDYSMSPREAAAVIKSSLDRVGLVDDLAPFVARVKETLWNEASIDYALPMLRRSALPSNAKAQQREYLSSDRCIKNVFSYDNEVYSRIKDSLS